jgi:hypothetical protein
MSGLAPFFIAASTALTAVGQVVQTGTDTAIAKATAAGQEQRANEERAVSQYRAQQRQKEAARLVSQQQAAFAASGGGLDGSAADVIARTAGRGELNSELELWSGESRARGLEDQAAMTRAAAKANQRALPLRIGATVLTGASRIAGASGAGDWGNGDPFGASSSPASRRRYVPSSDASGSYLSSSPLYYG